MAKLLLDSKFDRTGICPPEYVGENEDNFQFILNCHKERGVHYKVSERISDRERFAQQKFMPVPFFRGVACGLDCGNE